MDGQAAATPNDAPSGAACAAGAGPAAPLAGDAERSWPAGWVDGFPPDDWYADGGDDDHGAPPDDWYVHGGDEGHGAPDDPAPEPAWALAASAGSLRERLSAAASGAPGGSSAQLLERFCPDGHTRTDTDRTHGADGADGADGTDDADGADNADGADRTAAGMAVLNAAGLLDGVAGLQRLINWAQAAQQRYIAELARPGVAAPLQDAMQLAASPLGIACDVPDQPAATLLTHPAWGPALRQAAIKIAAVEVGCALKIAPVTARARTERAVTMVDQLPGTLAAQQAGKLDGYRASIIAERTAVLDPDQRRQVESAVLPAAADRTPARLRDLVDRQVVHTDPDAAARREQQARRCRGVHTRNAQDGMATLCADMTAADTQLSFGVLDHIARSLQAAGLAHGRGRSEIRADILADLFTGLATNGHATIDHLGHPATNTGATADTHTETTGTHTETETDTADDAGTGDADTHPADDAGTGDAHTHPADDRDGAVDTDPGTVDAVTDTADDPDIIDDRDTAVDTDTADSGGSADSVSDSDSDSDSDSADRPAPMSATDHAGPALPVCINVYVNASTLAGWDDEPAELAGHGIITAEFARTLADSAATIRTIAVQPVNRPPGDNTTGHSPPGPEWTPDGHSTNPARAGTCGTVLNAGRRRYRPGTAATDHINTRDRTCAFAGCRARADTCDVDHRLPWHHGGATCPCNNDALCRFHHAIKTFTAWRATPGPDGSLVWISPTGHRYPTEPGHVILDRTEPVTAEPAPGDAPDDPPPF